MNLNGSPVHDWLVVPGVGYRLSVASLGARIDLTRIRQDHHETVGLLTVRVTFRGAKTIGDGIVSSADFNCSALRTRKERANFLTERTNAKDIDWVWLLEEFCLRVLEAEDAGTPEIPIEQIPLSPEDHAELDAGGLPLLRRHPTIWFGDGGAAKSYLALYAMADLAQRGERVLYLDWEFSGEDHRRRLHRLTGPIPALPNLFYRRCDRALSKDVPRIREIISARHISFLVCDSVGFAADGTPEAAESATNYFKALRELGQIGSLHIAHVSKAEQGDQKPFGSVFWANGARATWYLKRTDADADPDTLTVGFYHRKTNVGRLRQPFAMRVSFIGTETRVCPASTSDMADHEELAIKMPLHQRMMAAVKHGAKSPTVLAEELQSRPDTVMRLVRRHDQTFVQLLDPAGDTRIGLKS